jgi:hypothetical protein
MIVFIARPRFLVRARSPCTIPPHPYTAMSEPQVVITISEKSVGISLILTFFFGPLGMLYSTVAGGLIMFAVSVVAFILTLGLGLFITWPICMIWGAMAASSYNRGLVTAR